LYLRGSQQKGLVPQIANPQITNSQIPQRLRPPIRKVPHLQKFYKSNKLFKSANFQFSISEAYLRLATFDNKDQISAEKISSFRLSCAFLVNKTVDF
jgi:hypothetical protein